VGPCGTPPSARFAADAVDLHAHNPKACRRAWPDQATPAPDQLDALLLADAGAGCQVESELSDGWFSAVYRVRLDDGRPAVVKLAVRRIRFGTRRQRLRRRKGPIAEMSEASSGTSQAQAGQPEQRAARHSPRPHLYAPALEGLAIVVVERTPDQSNRRTVRPLSYLRLPRPGVSAATFLHQHLAESTVTSHVSRILTDISARDRVQAVGHWPGNPGRVSESVRFR
jgi:hypothetical protein